MNEIAIELKLPSQHYQALTDVAQSRERSVAELVQSAVVEWLERQARLEHARALMRELGQGLSEGESPHDVARHHDAYLYARERV
jgi:Arc/MetJ-type ribon-helix-helix transcriptional regulator